jgi:hypothetical protein
MTRRLRKDWLYCLLMISSLVFLLPALDELVDSNYPSQANIVLESPGDGPALHADLQSLLPSTKITLAVATLVLNQSRYLQEWIELMGLICL